MMLMKVVVAFFLLSILSLGAEAEDANDSNYCSQLSLLAEQIMEGRQNGMPMRNSMNIAGEDELSQRLVKLAYNTRRYSSEEMKLKETTEFGNYVYMECIDSNK